MCNDLPKIPAFAHELIYRWDRQPTQTNTQTAHASHVRWSCLALQRGKDWGAVVPTRPPRRARWRARSGQIHDHHSSHDSSLTPSQAVLVCDSRVAQQCAAPAKLILRAGALRLPIQSADRDPQTSSRSSHHSAVARAKVGLWGGRVSRCGGATPPPPACSATRTGDPPLCGCGAGAAGGDWLASSRIPP